MTIEGEKVQAFSSITLNLPQQPTDYSQQIVDHSRATYAVSRQYIERFVSERYLNPEELPQQKQPPVSLPDSPSPKPKQSAPISVAHTALSGSIGTNNIIDKPKRKRTRKRRSKTDDTATTASLKTEEDHIIRLH